MLRYPVMANRHTLDDLIAELRGELQKHLEKGSTCSWTWSPGEGAPFTISALSTATTPPTTVGVTISLDEAQVEANYFGFTQDQYRFAVPRLPNGEYDLRWDAGPLPELCEPIATTLRRVRC